MGCQSHKQIAPRAGPNMGSHSSLWTSNFIGEISQGGVYYGMGLGRPYKFLKWTVTIRGGNKVEGRGPQCQKTVRSADRHFSKSPPDA